MPFRMRLMVVTLAAVFTTWTSSTDAGTGKRGEPLQSAELVRLVYPVADLVVPVAGWKGWTSHPVLRWNAWATDGERTPGATLESELMSLVQSSIAPQTWKEYDGAGTIEYYPLGMALVVNQTLEVQGEIRDLLTALRRLQEVEVCIEMRIVNVSSDLADEFRSNGGFEVRQDGKSGFKAAVLTDKEVYLWFRVFQNDSGTNIMQMPKATMLDGQKIDVVVGSKQPFVTEYRVVQEKGEVAIVPNREVIDLGLRCGLLPTVSADRRSVQLQVDFRHTALDGPVAEMPVTVRAGRKGGSEAELQAAIQKPILQTLAFKQACSIPDRRTLAVSLGKTSVDVRNEFGPPVLKDIPLLRRCFVNVGYGREDRELFLFITPRIIVTEAEEQPVLTEIPAVPRP